MAVPQFAFGQIGNLPLAYGIQNTAAFPAITDSGVILACRMKAQTANAITHVRFSAYVAAGTPPTMRVSLQSLDANGRPTGTVLGGGTPASATFTVAGGTPAVKEVALDNSYTPSVGDAFAVVVDYSSGTVDFSNYAAIVMSHQAFAFGVSQHFSSIYYAFGSWTDALGTPGFMVRTASERYGGLVFNGVGYESSSRPYKTVSTTGHRACAKIVLPSASYITSYDIAGFAMLTDLTASESVKAGIWNAAGTELKSVTIDTDYGAGAVGTNAEFDSVLSVAPGDTIYVGFESVSSSSCKIGNMDFASTDDRNAARGLISTSSIIYSSWNGSAWSDSTTDVPLCNLFVSAITGAASGGGGFGMVIGG